MCGRYALTSSWEQIKEYFDIYQGAMLVPRYNISPARPIPIIRSNTKLLEFAHWGFLPSWASSRDEYPASGYINIRMESRLKPSFQQAFKTQRCIIPVTGYYEWREESGTKQPYFVRSPEGLMGMAGVWCLSPQVSCSLSVGMVTLPSSGALKSLGDRQPLFLDKMHSQAWLKPTIVLDNFLESETPYLIDRVSHRVNNPKFDFPACIEAL